MEENTKKGDKKRVTDMFKEDAHGEFGAGEHQQQSTGRRIPHILQYSALAKTANFL